MDVCRASIAQQDSRLTAEGITNLFASQKDNIAAVLPSALGKLLGGTGLLDAVGGAVHTGAATASQAARDAGSAGYAAGQAGQRAARSATPALRGWLYWLIPAAAVAALLFYLFATPTKQ